MPVVLPEKLLISLKNVSSFNEEAFVAAHAAAAPVSLRSNRHKMHFFQEAPDPVPWCETGRYLPHRPVFTLDPAFHAGAYYVQEASSMFIGQALQAGVPAGRPLRVLDLCAAPGGKSTLLLDVLPEGSLLVANEVIRARADVLADNLTRWGRANAVVTQNDPRDFGRLPGFFDVLLIDAPCSGSGLFRKEPETVREWSAQAVELCSRRQQRILADALPALAEGGLLLYATCSYSPEENEENVRWLQENFSLEKIKLPAFAGMTDTGEGYRFWPDRLRGEGFFLAAFLKKEKTDPLPRLHLPKGTPDKNFVAAVQPWLAGPLAWLRVRDDVHGLTPGLLPEVERLRQSGLYLRKAGVRLGRLAGKDFLPDHELALSTELAPGVCRRALSRAEALTFLKRDPLPNPDGGTGWQLMTYEGLGLGWAKALPSRVNNYLPRDWRIRMEIPEN